MRTAPWPGHPHFPRYRPFFSFPCADPAVAVLSGQLRKVASASPSVRAGIYRPDVAGASSTMLSGRPAKEKERRDLSQRSPPKERPRAQCQRRHRLAPISAAHARTPKLIGPSWPSVIGAPGFDGQKHRPVHAAVLHG